MSFRSGLRAYAGYGSSLLCEKFRLQLINYRHQLFGNSLSNKSILKRSNFSQLFLNGKRPYVSLHSIIDEKEFSPNNVEKHADIESFVRRTHQTFGNTLPKDYLSKEEFKVYERLFGPPLRETTVHDIWKYVDHSVERPKNVLLRENEEGKFDEVPYELPGEFESEPLFLKINSETDYDEDLMIEDSSTESKNVVLFRSEESNLQQHPVSATQREVKAMIQIYRKFISERELSEEKIEMSKFIGEDNKESNEQDQEEDQELFSTDDEETAEDLFTSSDANRTHPHTMAGRSRSNPSTLSIPNQKFVVKVSEILTRTNPTHLQLAAERSFGGKALPFSVSVPSSMKHLPQKEIGLNAWQHRMSEIEADVYMSAVMPGAYASILSILIEVRKRLGQSWLREFLIGNGEGPSIIDAGSGGAGIIAWNKIVDAEWETMKDEGIIKGDSIPYGKSTVVTGSDSLRYRVSKLLDNTTFLPRLPDYVHATNNDQNIDKAALKGRKMYNIVIAPYTLQAEKENFKRKDMIKNLWTLVNPKGGILIVLEKGLPRGFEAIAEARSFVLKTYITSSDSNYTEYEARKLEEKENGMIVAPCTNHSTCPMYLSPGISSGRKDFCHFSQRYIRPPFLQKLLNAKARNHEDLKFSYIVFRRGIDERKNFIDLLTGEEATIQSFEGYEDHDIPESHQGEDYVKTNVKFNTLSLPRIILPPLKRHGHVILDVCTPSSRIERWTIPKSFSKAAYRDARKSKWGDLWALGAKTRVDKNLQLGSTIVTRAQKANNNLKKNKINKYDIVIGKDGFKRFERAGKTFIDRNERRTKGGRISKGSKPIGVDDF
ncbi:hypothetical protein HI914_01048 [Erysiphe necator]|nr:hypothetical protein HI914_01048 [Erysiphe necator]